MTRRYRPFDPFERGGPFEAREIRIPRPPRRFWVGLGLFGLALVIFFIASPIVWFFTELQWYDSLVLASRPPHRRVRDRFHLLGRQRDHRAARARGPEPSRCRDPALQHSRGHRGGGPRWSSPGGVGPVRRSGYP